MRTVYYLVAIVLFLTACSPPTASPDAVQTAIAQTVQANPTLTTIPSVTPSMTPEPTDTPTLTPTKTSAPTKTPTSTRTPTPTKTDTPTPLPPITQTAMAIAASQTQLVRNALATQTARASNITSTANAISRWATQIAPYGKIDYRELLNYPWNHKGEKIVITGRVFNIVGNKSFQMYYDWTYDAIYVKTKSSFSGLYENNYITVYGTIGGQECFENRLGAQICQPLLEDAFYTK